MAMPAADSINAPLHRAINDCLDNLRAANTALAESTLDDQSSGGGGGGPPSLGLFELTLAATAVVVPLSISQYLGLRLGRSVAIAMARSAVQLMALGSLILVPLFGSSNPFLVFCYLCFMFGAAPSNLPPAFRSLEDPVEGWCHGPSCNEVRGCTHRRFFSRTLSTMTSYFCSTLMTCSQF